MSDKVFKLVIRGKWFNIGNVENPEWRLAIYPCCKYTSDNDRTWVDMTLNGKSPNDYVRDEGWIMTHQAFYRGVLRRSFDSATCEPIKKNGITWWILVIFDVPRLTDDDNHELITQGGYIPIGDPAFKNFIPRDVEHLVIERLKGLKGPHAHCTKANAPSLPVDNGTNDGSGVCDPVDPEQGTPTGS